MKKILIIIAMIVAALLIAGNRHKVVGYEYDTCSTLWDLAERHCPESIDKRDFIEEVKRLNAMPDYKVYPERLYQYPTYKEAGK